MLVLQWDEIHKVSCGGCNKDNNNDSSKDKNDCIEIELNMNDGSMVHSFSWLHTPDKVWLVLMTLHNDALLGNSNNNMNRKSTPHGPSLKRCNSDPLTVQ